MEDFKKEKYKSTAKITGSLGILKAIKIIVVCFIIILLMLTTIGVADNDIDDDIVEGIMIFLCICFFCYIMVSRNYSFIENANLYVNNFKEDIDGLIKVSDLAFYVGQDEATVINNFTKLLSKRYLVNCKVENKNNTNYIVLNNSLLNQSMQKSDEIKEIVLKDIKDFNKLKHYKCPNCAATIKIDDINNVVCKYCSTKIVFQRQNETPLGDVNIKSQNKSCINYPKFIWNFIIMIIAISFFSTFTIASIGTFFGHWSEYSNNSAIIVVFLTFTGISLYLLIKNSKKIKVFKILSSYSLNIKGRRNAIIAIKDFAQKMKVSEQQAIKNLINLIKEGYLINCRLERENGKNYLLINESDIKQSLQDNTKIKEIVLKDIEEYNLIKNYPCPTCGATINIKDKDNVICDYCQTRLYFKRIIDNKTKKA